MRVIKMQKHFASSSQVRNIQTCRTPIPGCFRNVIMNDWPLLFKLLQSSDQIESQADQKEEEEVDLSCRQSQNRNRLHRI